MTELLTAELLTTQQVANILKVSAPTLQRWRTEGNGPRWIQVGRSVRYRPADIQSWIERQAV
jgi:excisionase family DNA binding protein